jgi:hypothetical protein
MHPQKDKIEHKTQKHNMQMIPCFHHTTTFFPSFLKKTDSNATHMQNSERKTTTQQSGAVGSHEHFLQDKTG